LRGTIWYIDTFKSQRWDPSQYNLGGDCYEIINRDFAPLNERLKILSQHLQHSDLYYASASQLILKPTREYTELAISQNEGGLDIFGSSLSDSIKISSLPQDEKDTLEQRIKRTVLAIRDYTGGLKKILSDKNYEFRDFRIGETLFNQKFRYDIVTDYSPQEIFNKATTAKNEYHSKMFTIANELWPKYCGTEKRPEDSLELIATVIKKVSLQHVTPEHFTDTITQQVRDLEHFIIEKNLFDYDTTYPLQVRIMPAYMSGVSLASASQAPPYRKMPSPGTMSLTSRRPIRSVQKASCAKTTITCFLFFPYMKPCPAIACREFTMQNRLTS
jgi:hypothetical protein